MHDLTTLGFISGMHPLAIIAILVLALLLFGNRLPEVARSIGRSMNEFKRGLKEVDDDIKKDPPKIKDRAVDEHEEEVKRTVHREQSTSEEREEEKVPRD